MFSDSKLGIVAFSGWGQKYNSLENIFTNSCFDKINKKLTINSIDYSKFFSFEDLLKNTHRLIPPDNSVNIMIGWSLGAQIVVRLVEKKVFNPSLIILISPPFQMVKQCLEVSIVNNQLKSEIIENEIIAGQDSQKPSRISAGMSIDKFNNFYQNFCLAPSKTLQEFSILTSMNDVDKSQIIDSLDLNNHKNWQFWLAELARFSCFDIDFSKMPRILFFQGLGDMVVHYSQAQIFQKLCPNFYLELIKNCGHAPHISNLSFIREKIMNEINNTI